MSSARSARTFATRAVLGAAAAVIFGLAGAGPAAAQSEVCNGIQPLLLERKTISDRITNASKGKKQIDARSACSGFGQLVSNGQKLVTWITANKDWCQVPDTFAQGVKDDHAKAVGIRGKACSIAAKQTEMEKRAKAGGGGGLLGGNGLSGDMRIPQGAL